MGIDVYVHVKYNLQNYKLDEWWSLAVSKKRTEATALPSVQFLVHWLAHEPCAPEQTWLKLEKNIDLLPLLWLH